MCLELLGLANSTEVDDLIAMRDLARERLLPALPNGPAASGPVFDGSEDLNGDTDLIAGGMLIDIKGQSGRHAPQRRQADCGAQPVRTGPAHRLHADGTTPMNSGSTLWRSTPRGSAT